MSSRKSSPRKSMEGMPSDETPLRTNPPHWGDLQNRPPKGAVARWLWKKRIWVESTFALSMLEPWEKILVRKCIFVLRQGRDCLPVLCWPQCAHFCFSGHYYSSASCITCRAMSKSSIRVPSTMCLATRTGFHDRSSRDRPHLESYNGTLYPFVHRCRQTKTNARIRSFPRSLYLGSLYLCPMIF